MDLRQSIQQGDFSFKFLQISIIICMHALYVITLKYGHIVAMGMILLQLPNSLSSTKLTYKKCFL